MVLIDLPVLFCGEPHAPEPKDGEFRRGPVHFPVEHVSSPSQNPDTYALGDKGSGNRVREDNQELPEVEAMRLSGRVQAIFLRYEKRGGTEKMNTLPGMRTRPRMNPWHDTSIFIGVCTEAVS
jgi:hypothetical protein